METILAGIYARISKDDGTALGVGRQLKDARAEAERRGYTIYQEWVDNDMSASKGIKRPGFEALLDATSNGEIQVILCFDLDRLTRTPSEMERLITATQAHNVQVIANGSLVDMSTPSGRLMARVKGAVAKSEVEQSSVRIKRKLLENAREGRSHGKIPFGWIREYNVDAAGRVTAMPDKLDPVKAEALRQCANLVLAGGTLEACKAILTSKDLTPPSQGTTEWDSKTISGMLTSARAAGLRIHHGQVIGEGDWEPLWDLDTHKALVARFSQRKHGTYTAPGSYLLTGCLTCAKCTSTTRNRHQTVKGVRTRFYLCRNGHYKLAAAQLDEAIEEIVLGRLETSGILEALRSEPDPRMRELVEEINNIQARIDEAALAYTDGLISITQLSAVNKRLDERLATARKELDRLQPPGVAALSAVSSNDVRESWQHIPLRGKHDIIKALAAITVYPVGKGRARNRMQGITIQWRGEDTPIPLADCL